jgi:hypothetical protein
MDVIKGKGLDEAIIGINSPPTAVAFTDGRDSGNLEHDSRVDARLL